MTMATGMRTESGTGLLLTRGGCRDRRHATGNSRGKALSIDGGDGRVGACPCRQGAREDGIMKVVRRGGELLVASRVNRCLRRSDFESCQQPVLHAERDREEAPVDERDQFVRLDTPQLATRTQHIDIRETQLEVADEDADAIRDGRVESEITGAPGGGIQFRIRIDSHRSGGGPPDIVYVASTVPRDGPSRAQI
jgi:hypothetical protein